MKKRISKDITEAFITLVRLGIGNSAYGMSKKFDWHAVWDFAYEHGLSAVVLDGIDSLPEHQRPPQELLLQWIGEILQNYEHRYETCRRTLAEMAAFYNSHGYKMMVLKGYACSLDWPKPEHRPCGDIDIWQFGCQKKADEILIKEKGIKVDTSHHHHTVFNWSGFLVENHYDFINVHHHRSNAEFEACLKKLGADDSHFVNVYGEKIYLPSLNLHALFLLRHTSSHFASEGINLRQVLDWGLFVKAHREEIDWKWLENTLSQFGMMEFYNIINAICVDDFGFEASIFTHVQYVPDLKDKVFNEIIAPEYGTDLPKGLLKRVLFKIRRWRGSAWKHHICYRESMWSAFWCGMWSHILKPSTI